MYIGKIDISSLMKVDSLADNATKYKKYNSM